MLRLPSSTPKLVAAVPDQLQRKVFSRHIDVGQRGGCELGAAWLGFPDRVGGLQAVEIVSTNIVLGMIQRCRMAKTVKRRDANINSVAAAAAVLMLVASVTDTASAKEYTVGGTTGWDYAPTTSFYSEWSNKLRIVPGDKIVFKYLPTAHNVQEVTEADYAACYSMNPIAEYQSGNDIVTLPRPDTHYYICGVLGHCNEGGMRMKVTVVAADSRNPAALAGSLPSPEASTPPTPASGTSGLARRGGDHANPPAMPPVSIAGHSAAQISAKPMSLSGMAVLWSVGAAVLGFIVGVGIGEVNVHRQERLHNVS